MKEVTTIVNYLKEKMPDTETDILFKGEDNKFYLSEFHVKLTDESAEEAGLWLQEENKILEIVRLLRELHKHKGAKVSFTYIFTCSDEYSDEEEQDKVLLSREEKELFPITEWKYEDKLYPVHLTIKEKQDELICKENCSTQVMDLIYNIIKGD